MTAVLSLLLVVALSMLVIRVGSVALQMTGLSEEVARFQALSAFSGAGFTTDEAETIMKNPARRKVAALLIRLGSVGLATSIAALIVSFVGAGGAAPERLLVLLAGGLALIALARSETFNRLLTPLIKRALTRYTRLHLYDYADLLRLREDYGIIDIKIREGMWLADQRLEELGLAAKGMLVLGVKRPGEDYIGAPPADFRLQPGDILVVYGREARLLELSG